MTICYTATSPHIAYEVHGCGDDTLIVVPGWVSNLVFDWATPEIRAFHERLAVTRRVVRYDKRGTGLSDYPSQPDTYALNTRVHDLAAVIDRVGGRQVTLFGWSEGGTIALTFAARYPERVSRLALFGTSARPLAAPDYLCGGDPAQSAALTALVAAEWGLGSRILASTFIPEADEARAPWFTTWQRVCLTPEAAVQSRAANIGTDIRALLPAIQTPTLVLHRQGDPGIGRAEYLVAHLPHAHLEILEGEYHIPFFGDALAITESVNRFLHAAPPATPMPAASSPLRVALTAREEDVLRHVAEGLLNREIAARLFLSEKTVNSHLVHIYAKLGINSRSAAVAHAFRHGYVSV